LEPISRRQIDGNARLAAARIVHVLAHGLEAGPAAVEPIGLVGLVALSALELAVELGAPGGLHLLDLGLADDALSDELFGVELQDRGVRADLAVHQGLGERGLVALVVAEAPVAEHVDDDGLLELLPVLGRHFRGEHHRLRIVAVAVEDRGFHHLGHVGRIGRGAREARIGGEADLVVDDEVDRAARAMTLEARQPEAFRDHALAREGRVAVDEERHHRHAVVRGAAVLVLLGAHLAQHHGIDDLEMRGVRGEREVDGVAVEGAVGGRAEMVLHVARALHVVGGKRAALELVEQRPVGLRHHLRQHVEAAAMGHAEHDLLHA
jgi:hypothetical protein